MTSSSQQQPGRLAMRESRMGSEAARLFHIAGICWMVGGSCAVGFLSCFAVFSSLNKSALATVAIILTFATSIPLIIGSILNISRTTHLVVDRYGFPKSARKSLKPRVLGNASLFDAWLADQRRLKALRSQES